jgi:hypothetical protein
MRLEIDLVNEHNQSVFEDRLLKDLVNVTVRRIRFLCSVSLNSRGIMPHPMYSRDILIAPLLPN